MLWFLAQELQCDAPVTDLARRELNVVMVFVYHLVPNRMIVHADKFAAQGPAECSVPQILHVHR